MKKIILSAILLIVSNLTFGQQTKPLPDVTNQDYLQKSKKQKKAAWILLGSGAALFIIAAVIPEGEETDEFNPYCWCNTNKNDGVRGAMFLVGGASMLGSIPFFIASGKNKRKAARISASLKMDTGSYLSQATVTKFRYPAIALKINL